MATNAELAAMARNELINNFGRTLSAQEYAALDGLLDNSALVTTTLTDGGIVFGVNIVASATVANQINRRAVGGAHGVYFHPTNGTYVFGKAGPGTAGESLYATGTLTNVLLRLTTTGGRQLGPWAGTLDDRVTMDVGGEFRAYIQKPDGHSTDINFEGGVMVSHGNGYYATPGYARTTQFYSLSGAYGTVLGNNNYTGAASPYNGGLTPEANGYIRFELGPIWPRAEKMRLNYNGELLLGQTLVRDIDASPGVSQTGTTITATEGAFTSADIGRWFAYGDYTNGGTESNCDKILTTPTGTTCTTERSRSIGLGQPGRIVTHKISLNGANGKITANTLCGGVATVASSSTPSINVDDCMQANIALATAITPSIVITGTPVDGQNLRIRITGDGTPRAIAWSGTFRSCGATLPTTTAASKVTYVGLVYNLGSTIWDCIFTVTQA